jgi:uncharacterized protein
MESLMLVVLAIIMEFIDSFLGMMYGTILSPLLIIMGYDVKTVVASILISQAIGGFMASWRHHFYRNADFSKGALDRKVTLVIACAGIIASIIGVCVSVNISPKVLNTYIALLVIVIGLMIFWGKTFNLTSTKIYILGFASAFNKALSGGGYGPLVAGGQLILNGRKEKGAIGSTDFAEAPICLFSFALWVWLKGFPDWWLSIPLCLGAAIGGFFGPRALSKIASSKKLKFIMAAIVLAEGLIVLWKVWLR